MGKLTKFASLTWQDRLLLFEALWRLGVARLAVVVVPFRFIAPRLGTARTSPPKSHPPSEPTVAARVSWAVTTMARHTPWKSACLVQAITAMGMLHRRRLPSTLYLGVDMRDRGSMTAHAWLTSAELTLTGAPVDPNLKIVSVFEDTCR